MAMEEDEGDSDPEVVQQKRLKLLAGKAMPFSCTIRVPYATEQSAQMVHDTLSVDAELTPDKVDRAMRVEGKILVIEIRSTEMRLIKAVSSSFFDMAMTATRFLCEFDAE